MTGWSTVPFRRYHVGRSSLTVGVTNVKVYGRASFRPLSAGAPASIVTSNLVAYGSPGFEFGVKTRIVVPDQRNVPWTAGVTWKNGGTSGVGIRPRETIGSE